MDRINLEAFENYVKNHLLSEGFEFRKMDGDVVLTEEGLECAGYFTHRLKHITIGAATADYPAVLAHEYCHFLQYLGGHSFFSSINGNEDLLDKWFIGEVELDAEEIDEFTQDIQLLELDCEKKTIYYLREVFKYTPEELETYIREANLYIWFIRVASDLGQWNCLNVPQSFEVISSMSPVEFIKEKEIANIPKDIYNLTVQLCFDKDVWYDQQLTEEETDVHSEFI